MTKAIRNTLALILAVSMAAACAMNSGTGTADNSGVRAAEANMLQVQADADLQKQSLIEISEAADSEWGIQLTRYGIPLEKGLEYRISFDYNLGESDARGGIIRLHKFGNPNVCYLESMVEFAPDSNTFSIDFIMDFESETNAVFALDLSRAAGKAADISIFNFKISSLEGDELPVIIEEAPMIHIDQLGYFSTEKKYAVIISDDPLFQVLNAVTGSPVYSGEASEKVMSYSAGEYVRIADFSDLATAGVYYIKNSEAESYEFSISNNEKYTELAGAVLGMFDYQKCGAALDAKKWAHDVCHVQPAYIYGTSETLDVGGGWHDAGDYGRYVVPASKAVADILLARELNYADDSVLDTVKYELEWLLKMQDSKTGGVYHKVTAESFCDEISPDEEIEKLIISPISAASTADFAAVTAMASRMYTEEFAATLLSASKKAWAWLEANPNYPGFKNPEGIVTGEYGDESDQDERYWAACELFHTTGEDVYHNYIKKTVAYSGFGWADMGFYGSVSYLNTPSDRIDTNTFFRIESSLIGAIQDIMSNYETEPYMVSLGNDYPWGSNMNVANNAMLLVFAIRLQGESNYLQPLRDHIHYLLGRNAMSQCYVTGFGSRPIRNPHHRPSQVAGLAVPGMLSGGPNAKPNDPLAIDALKGFAPAKSFIDNDQSYSTNEVAIYWNSPLFFVLSFLNSR